MALGNPPEHEQQIPLGGFTSHQFLVLIIESAKRLGWKVVYQSETGIIAYADGASGFDEVKVTIDADTAHIKSRSTNGKMIDVLGQNKDNIEALLEVLDQAKTQYTTQDLDERYDVISPGFVAADQHILNEPPPGAKQKFNDFLGLFIPRDGYFITPLLININILVFIAMVISGVNIIEPDNESLLNWGANFSPVTLSGQWWRLLTNCFLHIGILHLLFNMYALAYIGLLLEPLLGKAKFIAAYLLTGIAGSVVSLLMHSFIISAGASGAIFGMYGVFLAMLTTSLIEPAARKALLSSIGFFVVFNLMYGMKQGIDNAAHVGGLVSGLIIGYGFVASLKKPADKTLGNASIAVLSALVIIFCCIALKQMPNDVAKYDEKMKKFSADESMALEVFKMPANTPKEAMLAEIKDRGLYYWQQNIDLVNEMRQLDLPDPVQAQNKKLLAYCNLRVKSYKLMYKAIAENTPKYKDSIETCNKDIKAILDNLGTK